MISDVTEIACKGCSKIVGNDFEVLDRYRSHRELHADANTMVLGMAIVLKIHHTLSDCFCVFEAIHTLDIVGFREATPEETEQYYAGVRASARRSIIV